MMNRRKNSKVYYLSGKLPSEWHRKKHAQSVNVIRRQIEHYVEQHQADPNIWETIFNLAAQLPIPPNLPPNRPQEDVTPLREEDVKIDDKVMDEIRQHSPDQNRVVPGVMSAILALRMAEVTGTSVGENWGDFVEEELE